MKEAEYAKKIAPLREKGNLLLVTLLLTNTVFNEVVMSDTRLLYIRDTRSPEIRSI